MNTPQRLSTEEENELIACGLNKSLTIRPISRRRRKAAWQLAQAGYLSPKTKTINPYSRVRNLRGGDVLLTLSSKGKAYLLALNPADFAHRAKGPQPADIETLQRRLREAEG